MIIGRFRGRESSFLSSRLFAKVTTCRGRFANHSPLILQKSFLIDFSTFDCSDSGHTKYMYWLENYDQGWSAPSPLNFASFKYLNPGTYILHVKSAMDRVYGTTVRLH